jgi:hypothetical protein
VWGYKKNTEYKKYWYGAYLVTLLFLPLVFIFYGKRPSEYYFLIYFPLFFIVLSDFLVQKSMRYFAIIIAIIFIAINAPSFKNELSTNPRGLAAKKAVVIAITKNVTRNKKYAISFDGPPNTDTGFRYLLMMDAPQILPDNSEYPLIQVRTPARSGDLIVDQYGVLIPQQK